MMNGMKLFDLTGKKALVTGGSRGLGKGMAEGLMEAGAETILVGSSKKVFETAQSFSTAGFSCRGLQADLSHAGKRVSMFEEAVDLMGGLDILVNCAGIQRRHPAEKFPLDEWQEVLETNLTAAFHLSQMAAEVFLNVASMLSFFGGSTVAAYAASKGGIAQLTKAFCNDLAGRGINVNAIAPGYMDTELNAALTDTENPRFKEITGRIPAGRWGTADDMKGATVFLASSASDYLNGVVLPVDGGYLVK